MLFMNDEIKNRLVEMADENYRDWLINPHKLLENTLIIGKYHTNINNIYDEMNVYC